VPVCAICAAQNACVGTDPSGPQKLDRQQKTKLKTIRNNLSFLRSAIDEAVTDGLLTINPVTLVSASRYHVIDSSPNSDDYEVDPFTPAEISAIYQSCRYPEWENLFRFAFNTGLRSSELCALRWPDLDNIAKTAHVQAASVVGVLKGTKTKAGTRKVELNSEALAALQAQKQFTFMKSEFIFSDPKTGEPWANADAIEKKHGCQPSKKLAFDTVTRTRPATHSPPDILARA
jgi:integrase